MNAFQHRLKRAQVRAAIRRYLRPELIAPTHDGPEVTLFSFLVTLAALAAFLFLLSVPYLLGVAQ